MFDDLVELNQSKPWYGQGSLDYMLHRLETTSALERRYLLCRDALTRYGRQGQDALRAHLPKPKGWISFLRSDPLEIVAHHAQERGINKVLYGKAESGSLVYEEASIDVVAASLLSRKTEACPVDQFKRQFYEAATKSKAEAERIVLELYVSQAIAQRLISIEEGRHLAINVIKLYWSDMMAKGRYDLMARINELEKEELNEAQAAKLRTLKEKVTYELDQHPPTNLFSPLPDHVQGAIDLIADMKPKTSRIIDAAKTRGVPKGINSDRELYAASGRWKW